MSRPAAKPKSRARTAPPRCPHVQPKDHDDSWSATSAPGHTGGIFATAGQYLPRARGGFGFVQTSRHADGEHR